MESIKFSGSTDIGAELLVPWTAKVPACSAAVTVKARLRGLFTYIKYKFSVSFDRLNNRSEMLIFGLRSLNGLSGKSRSVGCQIGSLR